MDATHSPVDTFSGQKRKSPERPVSSEKDDALKTEEPTALVKRRRLVGAQLRRITSFPVTEFLPRVIPLQKLEEHEKVIRLGRHRDNDHQLESQRAPSLLSRSHCEIVVTGQEYSVIDKDTLNGTYLNGNLIPKGSFRLSHDDVLSLGGPANVMRGESRDSEISFVRLSKFL